MAETAGAWRTEVFQSLRLGIPIAGAQVAQMAINTTDVVMIGWLGAVELAAAVLAFNLYIVIWLFGIGVLQAVVPLAAKARGERRPRDVRRSVRMGFWFVAFYSIPTLGIMWFTEDILLAFGQHVRILIHIRRSDGVLRLLAGEGVAKKTVGVDRRRIGCHAAGPGGNGAAGVAGTFGAHRGKGGLQLGRLFRRDGCADRQRKGAEHGATENLQGSFVNRFHRLLRFLLEVNADADSNEVAVSVGVVVATEEVGVVDAGVVLVVVHPGQADAGGHGAFNKVRTGAVNVV